MKIYSFLKKSSALLALSILFACDTDFNSVGADIVDNENIQADTYISTNTIAYNRATGAVQSNQMPLNGLGVLNNPVFGKTIASYVTQLKLTNTPSDISGLVDVNITSAELTIPYYSTLKSTNSDGSRVFELDSLYGSTTSKIRLNIYESGYYMREFDPSTNFEQLQKYYTDMYEVINNAKNPQRLNDSENISENDLFFFSNAEHVIYEENASGESVVKERLNPQMKLKLNKAFFLNKIFNAPSGQIDNTNAFNSYFKGLFFQVEDLGQDSHWAQLNFGLGKITISYTHKVNGEQQEGIVILELKGNSINLFQNTFSEEYSTILANANPTTGDERLYLKGGEGSMAYIDLFAGTDSDGDGVSDELQELRTLASSDNEAWLINEANLIFYIDQERMNENPFTPLRIHLFDTEKKVPLLDYYYDSTSNYYFPKFNKWMYGGLIERDTNKKGYLYKLRITKHIQNLLKDSSTKNVKLGLVVTEDINTLLMGAFKNGTTEPEDSPYKFLPITATMNPFGTVLYGSNAQQVDKKLKLEIKYTKKP